MFYVYGIVVLCNVIISLYKLVSVNANICSICQCLHQPSSVTLLSELGEGQPLMVIVIATKTSQG